MEYDLTKISFKQIDQYLCIENVLSKISYVLYIFRTLVYPWHRFQQHSSHTF